MEKITDYQILTAHHSDELSPAVCRAIRNGWEPLGGVSVILEYYADGSVRRYTCAQAMVRRDPIQPSIGVVHE